MANNQLISDEVHWLGFKRGEKEAFAQLYQRYVHPRSLYNYGYKVTSDARIIEDSIQDLFISLWNSHQNLSDTTSVKFYLFRSLRRAIAQKLATDALPFESSENAERTVGIDSVFSYETYLIEAQKEAEKVAALQKAIEKLTKRQRQAIILRFYNNFIYEEIAGIVSLNYKSVCNLIYKALDLLKENITLLFIWLVSLVFQLNEGN